jgi:hypothetical protein
MRRALLALKSDAVVVLLGRNQINKFTRENKDVERFDVWAPKQVETDGSKFLDTDGIDVLSLDDDDKKWVKKLDVSQIDDPNFVRIKGLIEREDALLKDYHAAKELAGKVGAFFKEPRIAKSLSVTKNYPLLAQIDNSWYRPAKVIDDTYIYINAAYAARKEANV